MIAVRLLPVVLSLLVLGAHFLRAGNVLTVLLILGLMALVWVRRPWAGRLVQTALVLGALEWAWTLATLARARMQTGEPFVRLVAILAGVAVVTALSALIVSTAGVRRWYGLDAQVGTAGRGDPGGPGKGGAS